MAFQSGMADHSSKINGPIVTSDEVCSDRKDDRSLEEVEVTLKRGIVRATWTIFCGVALPVIPVIVITAILLYFIKRHQITFDPGWPELQTPTTASRQNLTSLISKYRKHGGEKAYYVKYNATTITTIAAWTGRVIPYLSSSIMALVAFYAAHHIVRKTKHGSGSSLPSPEQLAILIGLLEGSGFGPLRDTLLFQWRVKEKLILPIVAAFAALFMVTFLGILIPIIDSWFGITTATIEHPQLQRRTATLRYSRGISETFCPSGARGNGTSSNHISNADEWWPCNIALSGCQPKHVTIDIKGTSDGDRIQLDASRTDRVHNYTDHISGVIYHYLGDPEQNETIDYKATTLATSSQCIPMTQNCITVGQIENDVLFNFSCTPNFTGSLWELWLNASTIGVFPDIRYTNIGIAFSKNAQLTETGGNVTHQSANQTYCSLPEIYTTNPLYYGSWAIGYPVADRVTPPVYPNDPGIIYVSSNRTKGGIWMMNCSTTVYDVSYTWVNGTVQSFNASLASTDTSALLSSPFALSSLDPYIASAHRAIARLVGTGNSSHEFASAYATGMSRALLAYSIGALEPQLNIAEQARNLAISVSRVPLIPLYCLVATKAFYVLAIFILAVVVYCFTKPAETEIVKGQLSIKGLAASHFDPSRMTRQSMIGELQKRVGGLHNNEAHERTGDSSPFTSVPTRPGETHLQGTSPIDSEPAEDSSRSHRVGLVPTADGGWQFAMVAGRVWTNIKPVVKTVVYTEARAGRLGGAGQILNAWKR